jgi:hypothetical protein
LSLSPSSLQGGASSQGTVTLSAAAPPGILLLAGIGASCYLVSARELLGITAFGLISSVVGGVLVGAGAKQGADAAVSTPQRPPEKVVKK